MAIDNSFQNLFLNTTTTVSSNSYHKLCLATSNDQEETCDQLFSYVPLVLIFLSQFILGIGNTLYYSLGQSYLDDNTKKTNTPKLLGFAFSIRMVGPMLGFVLSYVFLNIYIDPTKTPVITSKDPRWMGAWWMGWIVLGFSMIVFAFMIGLFPRDLPKKSKDKSMVENGRKTEEGAEGLMADIDLSEKDQELAQPIKVKSQLKDFPTALRRLVTNKLLMFNILAGVFYILGMGGFMTFMSKYIEVQFNKNKSDSTIVAGPLNLFGMVLGLLGSGYYISKKKPTTSRLLMWNVLIGALYMGGQVSYMFLSCSDDLMPMPVNGKFNLTSDCNFNCHCGKAPYNPVCDQATGQTFFSACHAGCSAWDANGQVSIVNDLGNIIFELRPPFQFYSNCSCSSSARTLDNYHLTFATELTPVRGGITESTILSTTTREEGSGLHRKRRKAGDQMDVQPGACLGSCERAFIIFIIVSGVINT